MIVEQTLCFMFRVFKSLLVDVPVIVLLQKKNKMRYDILNVRKTMI